MILPQSVRYDFFFGFLGFSLLSFCLLSYFGVERIFRRADLKQPNSSSGIAFWIALSMASKFISRRWITKNALLVLVVKNVLFH